MKYIISLEVADFDKFKSLFDSRESHRSAAGLTATAYRNLDVPNNPCVIGTGSKEVLLAFLSDPDQQAAMKEGGILAPPKITFLEEA